MSDVKTAEARMFPKGPPEPMWHRSRDTYVAHIKSFTLVVTTREHLHKIFLSREVLRPFAARTLPLEDWCGYIRSRDINVADPEEVRIFRGGYSLAEAKYDAVMEFTHYMKELAEQAMRTLAPDPAREYEMMRRQVLTIDSFKHALDGSLYDHVPFTYDPQLVIPKVQRNALCGYCGLENRFHTVVEGEDIIVQCSGKRARLTAISRIPVR